MKYRNIGNLAYAVLKDIKKNSASGIDKETAEEKTKIISFSRFRKYENTSFEILGFEYRWTVSRKGKTLYGNNSTRK